ncbi:MAG: hypothetical protein U1E17_04455 [Geminicoccaceae bacterium]
MAALMKLGAIHVLTHDSIALGQDAGLTHQPIEHLATLRLIPNLDVWRPCDTVETAIAWQVALEQGGQAHPPRPQPPEPRLPAAQRGAARGGAQGRLRAAARGRPARSRGDRHGLGGALAVAAAERLAGAGIGARVVLMPSPGTFDRQLPWRTQVLPPACCASRVEAGVTDYWRKYVGSRASAWASTASATRQRRSCSTALAPPSRARSRRRGGTSTGAGGERRSFSSGWTMVNRARRADRRQERRAGGEPRPSLPARHHDAGTGRWHGPAAGLGAAGCRRLCRGGSRHPEPPRPGPARHGHRPRLHGKLALPATAEGALPSQLFLAERTLSSSSGSQGQRPSPSPPRSTVPAATSSPISAAGSRASGCCPRRPSSPPRRRPPCGSGPSASSRPATAAGLAAHQPGAQVLGPCRLQGAV